MFNYLTVVPPCVFTWVRDDSAALRPLRNVTARWQEGGVTWMEAVLQVNHLSSARNPRVLEQIREKSEFPEGINIRHYGWKYLFQSRKRD